MKVIITGVDELLRAIPSGRQHKAMLDRVANKTLLAIEKASKERTMVRTSRLRRSIFTQLRGFKSGYVSTNTNYAIFPHEGWGSNRKYGRRPFMEQGVQAVMEGAFSELVKRELDNFYK